MHAYYRSKRIEYRYIEMKGKKRRFQKTSKGAYKYWELERCINVKECPLDPDTKNNLRFLIGIRHEIEHQMTNRIDEFLSAKLQACAMNYDYYLVQLFGQKYSVAKELAICIQFSAISPTQKRQLMSENKLTSNVKNYIAEFEDTLSESELKSIRYAYRILYTPISANRKGQADSVIEFVKPDSELACEIERVLIKETEKPKFRPSEIVKILREEGYPQFNMLCHTKLWQQSDAKNPAKGYGTKVSGQWYWYQNWIDFVRQHCQESGDKYK